MGNGLLFEDGHGVFLSVDPSERCSGSSQESISVQKYLGCKELPVNWILRLLLNPPNTGVAVIPSLIKIFLLLQFLSLPRTEIALALGYNGK